LIKNPAAPEGILTVIKAGLPPKTLPLQLLLTLSPSVRRFIFVYRQEKYDDRIKYELEKMEKYLDSHNRHHIRMPIINTEAIFDDFSKEIQNQDGIVVVNASTLAKDLDPLSKACKNKKALLFAEANNTTPPDAICGYSSDLEFLGHKGALYLKKICLDKTFIKQLPVVDFENASGITVNKNTACDFGIELYDNMTRMFSAGKGNDFRLNLRFVYDCLLQYNSILGKRFYERLVTGL
jgi:ABC-type uncharacterized transport system substrate-binding protein